MRFGQGGLTSLQSVRSWRFLLESKPVLVPKEKKNEKEGPWEHVPGHLQMLIKDGVTDLISKREKTNSRRRNGFPKIACFFVTHLGLKSISFWLQIYTFFFPGQYFSLYLGLSAPPIFQFENQFWNSKWCIFKVMLKFPHKCCVASMVCQAENLIDVSKVPSIVFLIPLKPA